MKKLTSMVDFVLKNTTNSLDYGYNSAEVKVNKYAKFLSQKLELWMFVPCKLVGGVWVVLEEPVNYSAFEVGMSQKDFNFCFHDCQEYQEAKYRVLFEGGDYIDLQPSTTWNYFHINGKKIFEDSNTRRNCSLGYKVEDLANMAVKLTESAKKQIGL